MTSNLFGTRSRPDPDRIHQIKGWVAESFVLPEEAAVMVTEVQCSEPGCPPLEIVIAILDGSGRNCRHELPKAVRDVTRDDVVRLASGAGGVVI